MVNVSNAVSVVSLEDVKAFLRVDHDLEDAIISNLILVATMNAETRLKRPIIEREGEESEGICETLATVPQSIKQWVMMFVGYLYAHRELVSSDSVHEMQFCDSLLDAWRLYE